VVVRHDSRERDRIVDIGGISGAETKWTQTERVSLSLTCYKLAVLLWLAENHENKSVMRRLSACN